MMGFKNLPILLLGLFIILSNCISKTNIVKIESISPRIEVSHEDNLLVIRAIILENSYLIIGDYILQCDKDTTEKVRYLLSFVLIPPNKPAKKNITSTAWSGIELHLPVEQIDSLADLYYFDGVNKRKICWGTKETWRKNIDEHFKNSKMSDSQRIEMLNNFDKK